MDTTKTAAPKLTAEERGMLASVRDDWAWEDNNRNEDAVVSQREYVENLRVTFAIIDRLLAAGAPTAAAGDKLALRKALEPFAKMHRDGCDLDEVACERGVASDLTLITSRDFANAAYALSADAAPAAEGGGA